MGYTVSCIHVYLGTRLVELSGLVHTGRAEGKTICHSLNLWQPTELTEERGHGDTAERSQWAMRENCSDAFEDHGCQQSSCHCVRRNFPIQLLARGKTHNDNKRETEKLVLNAPYATT